MTTCPASDCPIKSNRSSPDHKRYFGLIRVAFHHWPEGHAFKPDDETHLRKWLQVKANYRTVTPIEIEGDVDPKVIAGASIAAIEACGSYPFVTVHNNTVYVHAPKSIQFKKLMRADWNELREKVEAVLENELGMSAEQLLKEHEAAA